MMLLAEGKPGEAWNLLKTSALLEIGKLWIEKVILLSSLKVSIEGIHSKIVGRI